MISGDKGICLHCKQTAAAPLSQPGATAQQTRQRNYFSIASFICGFTPFVIETAIKHPSLEQGVLIAILAVLMGAAAVILGIVGLVRATKLRKGSVLAILGILFGLISVINKLVEPIG